MRTTSTIIVAAGVAAIVGSAAGQHDHEGDFVVGVNGAGVLTVEGDFDGAHYLPPFNDGGVHGWFGTEPGFRSLEEDEPDEDFFMLGAGADISFELVSVDPASKVYDPFFNLLGQGDSFAFGGHVFDEHPFWHIDSDDAAFDPNQTIWNVAWKVVDLGSTGYGASERYTSQFTNIPAPGALIAGLVGLGAACRRRR